MQEPFSVPLPPCCYSYFSAEQRFAALIGSQSTASIGLQRGGQIITTLSKANLLLLFDSSHFLYALTWSSFSLQQAKCLRSIVTVPLLRSGQADTLASHVRGTNRPLSLSRTDDVLLSGVRQVKGKTSGTLGCILTLPEIPVRMSSVLQSTPWAGGLL